MRLISRPAAQFLDHPGLEKKDGILALFMYIYLIGISVVYFRLSKGGSLDFLTGMTGKMMANTVMFILLLVPIGIVLLIRKQSLSSVGLGKPGRKQLLLLLALGAAYFIYYEWRYGYSPAMWSRLYIYVITVGFCEELVFRGFIWPRLNKLFGVHAGTIVTGLMFGFAHVPLAVIWYDNVLWMALYSNIGFGIIGHLMFGYFYTKSRHLLVPSLIHGLMDAL